MTSSQRIVRLIPISELHSLHAKGKGVMHGHFQFVTPEEVEREIERRIENSRGNYYLHLYTCGFIN